MPATAKSAKIDFKPLARRRSLNAHERLSHFTTSDRR